MICDELTRRIEAFEKLSQKITLEIVENTVLQKVSPLEIWRRAELSINELRDLSRSIKDDMLLLKPEKHLTIKKVYQSLNEPLEEFRKILLQETGDAADVSRKAFEKLRGAIINGTEFIVLAKEVAANPSKNIVEIMRLREIAEAKEYISTVSAPETFLARIKVLIDQTEFLESSIKSLESKLESIHAQIEKIKGELKKIRADSESGLEDL